MNTHSESNRIRVRLATPADVDSLKKIELAAAASLSPFISQQVLEETTDPDDFLRAVHDGLLWVAESESRIVGFALVEMLASNHPHLEEIDVHPEFQRRGVGRALLEAVLMWLRRSPCAQITLTTFRNVPWNAPFYKSLGFRVLAPADYSSELEELLKNEVTRGLDSDKRVAMSYISP